jgi:hypothetical protein
LLGGQGGECVCGHDDINLERNQFGRKSGEPSMTSQPVALLLATLGVVPSHSRPHVSNDKNRRENVSASS